MLEINSFYFSRLAFRILVDSVLIDRGQRFGGPRIARGLDDRYVDESGSLADQATDRLRPAGVPRRLERLLEMYRNYLRLVARTSLDAAVRAKADPSDMVQETLIKAHANFGQFQGSTEADLIAWLRQILANNILDLVPHQICRDRFLSLV